MGMMEQRKKKVPVFLRQAIRQGIGVTIAVLLGYAIADTLGGAPLRMLSYTDMPMAKLKHTALQCVHASTSSPYNGAQQ